MRKINEIRVKEHMHIYIYICAIIWNMFLKRKVCYYIVRLGVLLGLQCTLMHHNCAYLYEEKGLPATGIHYSLW